MGDELNVLLAKLYAEQLIAVKDNIIGGATQASPLQLPDNIPDLMLSYLNELNRDVGGDKFDNRTVQQDAKALAWECLKGTYRPATAKREDAIAALSGDNAEAKVPDFVAVELGKRAGLPPTAGLPQLAQTP